MTFYLYVAESSLAVIFSHFLIGLSKLILFWCLFLFFFARPLHLEYSPTDESDEFDEEESDKLGSESRSYGTFGTVLVGLLRGVGFSLDVTISVDDSCDGD